MGNVMECVYKGGGGIMDNSEAAVSQKKGRSTFQGRGETRDNPELVRRQRK